MKEKKQVTFLNWLCDVSTEHKYDNDRTAITLTDAKTGEPVLTASTNLPELPCGENEAWIKEYSENNGIERVLINAGVISKPIASTVTFGISINKCKILI